MKPEVSVIIPAYNSEQYISKALQSIFAQSYHNFEVILVDDASQDATVSIAHSFQDKRLKIIKNQQNRGVSYNRNLGIRQAQGKWIALLDSDDWYALQRLEKLVAAGEKYHADLVADDLFLIKDEQQQHWSTLINECSQIELSSITLIDAVKFVISDRLSSINAKRSWSLGYTKPLIRREFLLANQIWYDENLKVGEDFSLYLECLRQQGQFYLLPQPYYYYRTREQSLSARKPTAYLAESCAITQSFIQREVITTPESPLRKVLLGNFKAFEQRLIYYRFIENIKDKKILKALDHLINHPDVIGDLVRKLWMILLKKTKSLLAKNIWKLKVMITSIKFFFDPNLKELWQVLK